jgi:hypothetical protein
MSKLVVMLPGVLAEAGLDSGGGVGQEPAINITLQ